MRVFFARAKNFWRPTFPSVVGTKFLALKGVGGVSPVLPNRQKARKAFIFPQKEGRRNSNEKTRKIINVLETLILILKKISYVATLGAGESFL